MYVRDFVMMVCVENISHGGHLYLAEGVGAVQPANLAFVKLLALAPLPKI